MGVDGGVKRLVVHGRRTAELPHGNLGVLRFDSVGDIFSGHLHAVQLVGIQPDTHGVLRAVGVDITHAVDTAERVLNITGDVVRDVLLIHRAIG